MFLYDTVSFDDFLEAFEREGCEKQFSYDAKRIIYEYLWELAEFTREPIKLDIVGVCREFSEYESVAELLEELFPDYVTEWEQGELSIDDVHELIELDVDVVSFDVNKQGKGLIIIQRS